MSPSNLHLHPSLIFIRFPLLELVEHPSPFHPLPVNRPSLHPGHPSHLQAPPNVQEQASSRLPQSPQNLLPVHLASPRLPPNHMSNHLRKLLKAHLIHRPHRPWFENRVIHRSAFLGRPLHQYGPFPLKLKCQANSESFQVQPWSRDNFRAFLLPAT